MARIKEIVALLAVVFLAFIIFCFVLTSITSLILPPSQANYGDKVVEDIGGDGILVATLQNCVKISESRIADDYFDTDHITNLSWSGAKNISYVDTLGKKGYIIVWKASPDKYSVLNTNSDSYISDNVEGIKGLCFIEYSPKTNSVYGIIISTDEISCSEYNLMYNILKLDRTQFSMTYDSGYTYGGDSSHYGGVDNSPYALARSDPDWYYDDYDYGDYDDIDEYLESEGYD